jgi:hypothetical protein
MRIAYLVCSHTNPEQVKRLVTLLATADPTAEVVVRHDQSKTPLDRGTLPSLPNVHLLGGRGTVSWGGYSQVETVLRSMRWMTENLSFDWLLLLSGQDYPIQPLPHIKAFLETTPYDGFIRGTSVEELDASRRAEARRRYLYAYYRVPAPRPLMARAGSAGPRPSGGPGLTARETGSSGAADLAPLAVKTSPAEGALYIGFRRRRTPFSPSFRCYRGGFWFSISARCVDSIKRFVSDHPDVVGYFRRVRIPDEALIDTILLNDRSLNVLPDHLRYIRFPKGGGRHPEVLTTRDLEPMLASGRHFARKFEPAIDAVVLDLLDQRLHGSGQSYRS